MAFYDLAHGGDNHDNPGLALYPQNIFRKSGKTNGGKSLLLHAEEHRIGLYNIQRSVSFAEPERGSGANMGNQLGLQEFLDNLASCGTPLAVDDEIAVVALGTNSMLIGAAVRVCCPAEGVAFDIVEVETDTVLGSVDAATAGTQIFNLGIAGGIPVADNTNSALAIRITAWPEAPEPSSDPNCVFPACPDEVGLCFDVTGLVWQPFDCLCPGSKNFCPAGQPAAEEPKEKATEAGK